MIKNLPKEFLSTSQRKAMWKDASKIIKKLDKNLNFSEIYAIGSFVSKKKRPCDIDIALVAKAKTNTAWPIDLVLIPKAHKTNEYIKDIKNWMKKRYSNKCKPIKLK